MEIIYHWPTWVTVFSLLGLMFASNEVGYRLGRSRNARESERAHSVSHGLKGSVLGLVALLLGFSFSMTTSRHNERQHLVLDEANAIGTCYLRAGLLTKPSRDQIRNTLRQYADLRLEHFENALDPDEFRRTTKAMDAALTSLWASVEAAFAVDRESVRVSQIVAAANAVIDLSATRAWASHNHTPASVIVLLGICAVVASGLMGHSSGQSATRHIGLWIALNILIVLVLYVILDFDRPRRGLIQLNHQPLIELRESISARSN